MIGGLFEKSGKKELDNENWAKPKSRVEHVRESGFCLQELGREMTAEFEDTMREELRTAKGARKVGQHAYKIVDEEGRRRRPEASCLAQGAAESTRPGDGGGVDVRENAESIGANEAARRRTGSIS